MQAVARTMDVGNVENGRTATGASSNYQGLRHRRRGFSRSHEVTQKIRDRRVDFVRLVKPETGAGVGDHHDGDVGILRGRFVPAGMAISLHIVATGIMIDAF